jgi:hypothetical protein
MDWQRVVLGPRGRGLGRGRWPLTTILAIAAGVYAGLAGDWTMAAILFAAAVVFGTLTLRSLR